jgi:hypothetical protein
MLNFLFALYRRAPIVCASWNAAGCCFEAWIPTDGRYGDAVSPGFW